MTVKRYDCSNGRAQHCYGCYTMEEHEDGEYVKSEDYDKLLGELEKMKSEDA